MLQSISHKDNIGKCQNLLERYDEAGLSHAECAADIRSTSSRMAYEDGYADGVIVGSIGLLIGGVIAKLISRRVNREESAKIERRINHGFYMKSLTQMAKSCVPDEDGNRDENT